MTAIADAESEDRVIATLVQDDFTLMQRCHSVTQLKNYLSSRADDQRLIIVTDEEFGLSARDYSVLASEQRALLQLGFGDFLESEVIKTRVNEALRRPEITIPPKRQRQRREDFLTFTGSSGSPGISTVALNVASELSEYRGVELVDADPLRRDLHQRLGFQSSENIQLTANFKVRSIESYDFTSSYSTDMKVIKLFDLGAAPSLTELLTDRRKTAREFLEILEQSLHIVYVAQSESFSISELEKFRSLVDHSIPGTSVTYVLNKAGTSNRQRGVEKSFKARMSDNRTFCLPREYPALDRAQGQYSTLMEVAPRSGLRKAIKELSIYLDNSI